MTEILAWKLAKYSFENVIFVGWLTPVEIYYVIQQGVLLESILYPREEINKRISTGNGCPLFVSFKLDKFIKENQYNELGFQFKRKMKHYENHN